MFNSIKTNKYRNTGFPSLKVIKNLELLCLYFLIFYSRQQIIYADISLLDLVHWNLTVVFKSLLHSIL